MGVGVGIDIVPAPRYRILKFMPADGGVIQADLLTSAVVAVRMDLGNGYYGTLTFPASALDTCPETFEKME